MKTFFAFTTGALVGLFGAAIAFMADPDVRRIWNTTADEVQK